MEAGKLSRDLSVRDVLFQRLPSVCRSEIRALLLEGFPACVGRAESLWEARHTSDNADSEALWADAFGPVLRLVTDWTQRYRIPAPWLTFRLARAIDETWDGEFDAGDVTPASVDRFAAALEQTPYRFYSKEEWAEHSKAPAALVVGTSFTALTVGRDSPALPLDADPTAETQQQFLDRAVAHYRARLALCEARGLPASRSRPELQRDCDWLLWHRVCGRSYATIAKAEGVMAGAVEKAIRRLAVDVQIRS